MTLTKTKLDTIRFCSLVLLTVGLFVPDHYKTTIGAIVGYSIVFIGVGVAIWASQEERKRFPEPEEEEEDEDDGPKYFMTVGELIGILENMEDQTVVVVDSHGEPITSVSTTYDEDFACATWLRAANSGRQRYRDFKYGPRPVYEHLLHCSASRYSPPGTKGPGGCCPVGWTL